MTKDQLYKELSKRLREEGQNANIDDLVNMSGDNLDNSRQTRDLLEEYIGSEMMKNSGTSIDLKNDKAAKKTLEGLTKEYTDIKNPKWDVYDLGEKTVGGLHTDGTFGANTRFLNKDSVGQLVAHEPIHKMVRDSGGTSIPDNVMSAAKKNALREANILSGSDLAKKGALVGHEIMQMGHLNPDAKTTSSLRNAIAASTGKFGKLMKSVPLVGPLAAGGLTYALTGDAEAAQQAGVPGLNEAEGLGPEKNSLEADIEDPTKTYEQRRKAIEILSNRNNQ